MNELQIVSLILYCIILVSLFANLGQLYVESKKLRAQGKTPLVFKNVVTILVATLGEVVAVALSMYIISSIGVKPTAIYIAIIFILVYNLKNIAAYLSAWGTWSLFVSVERNKMKKEIKEDMEKEGV